MQFLVLKGRDTKGDRNIRYVRRLTGNIFLSNLILLGIQLGPTDLLESKKDMTFSISVLSIRLKKGDIRFVFKLLN